MKHQHALTRTSPKGGPFIGTCMKCGKTGVTIKQQRTEECENVVRMTVSVTDLPSFSQLVVGNVYAIGGGYGRRAGHAMILLAITKASSALMLVIDKEGDPIGVTSYGLHAIEERAPIAYVRGLDDLNLTMEALS